MQVDAGRTWQPGNRNEVRKALQCIDRNEKPKRSVSKPRTCGARSRCGTMDTRLRQAGLHEGQDWEKTKCKCDGVDARCHHDAESRNKSGQDDREQHTSGVITYKGAERSKKSRRVLDHTCHEDAVREPSTLNKPLRHVRNDRRIDNS